MICDTLVLGGVPVHDGLERLQESSLSLTVLLG